MSTPAPSQRRDLAVAAWGGGAFGLVLASYGAFRPLRDALVLDGSPDTLPWLFTTTFVVVAVLAPVWSKALARRPPRALVVAVFHVFAMCELTFAALVHGDVAPLWVGRAFYVWSAVFNLFVVSVVWSALADALPPQAARRWYGPVAAAGTIGAIVGPALAGWLVGQVGVAGVLVVSAVLLELAAVCLTRTFAFATARSAAPAAALPPLRLREAIARVARSRYLAALVGYVVCTACAATLVYVLQARIAQHTLPDRVARAAFFASVDMWTNVGVLVVQTTLAPLLLARVGPGLVLCVLPIAQVAGISALALTPSLGALAALAITTRVATHGLTRPARELLFTVVAREDKYRAKNAIDTAGYRFGDFIASWIALAGASAGATIAAIVPLVGLWLWLARRLGSAFKRASRNQELET